MGVFCGVLLWSPGPGAENRRVKYPADPLALLVPAPRQASIGPDTWQLPERVRVSGAETVCIGPALKRLARALARRGARPQRTASGGDLQLEIDGDLEPEAYAIEVGEEGAIVRASSGAGLSHGLSTLAQWVDVSRPAKERALAEIHIQDTPAFAERGVMVDVARGRVPTMKTLFELVERLAAWKVNRLQLYMEASFAYAGHEAVWAGSDPFTPVEITALDAACRARHIELVPNQQSLGHMHRWLIHPAYRDLAECPEGVEHPFSREPEPFSLAPADPRGLALLADLYDQLLPCFSSRVVNVGLDETFDIGLGRSKQACATRGPHAPYIDHLLAVAELLAERGFQMQFWGDVVLEEPACIERIPAGAEAMVWGYEADHPFTEQLPHFARAGLPFQVCPGTSSWNSIAGRTHNALANLQGATRAGMEHGARGVLVCDWGDRGHLQAPWASSMGWLCGAACSWNPESAARLSVERLPDLLDRHAFDRPRAPLGRIAVDLAGLHRPAGGDARNGTSLFFLVAFADQPFPHAGLGSLDAQGLESSGATARALADELATTTAGSGSEQLWCDEMRWCAEFLHLGARLGLARLRGPTGAPISDLPGHLRRGLKEQLEHLVADQRLLWLQRSRAGGLERALAHLVRLRTLL